MNGNDIGFKAEVRGETPNREDMDHVLQAVQQQN
jgi:hypothetical protein